MVNIVFTILGSALLLIATWFFVLAVITGIGFLVLKLIGVELRRTEIVFSAFWLGWAAVIVVLQLWHFLAPIDEKTFIALSIPGIAGLVYTVFASRKNLAHQFLERKLLFSILAVCLLVFMLWLANRAMGGVSNYDAGLYHLNAIRWTRTYPVVPGLGNLHGRLAFNNSYFLFLALLDIGPWLNKSYHLGGGLMLLAITLQIARYGFRAVTHRSELRNYEVFGIILTIPIVNSYFSDLTNTAPDLPVFVLGAVIGIRLFKVIFDDDDVNDVPFDTIFIIILSAVGLSVKLSFLVFGGMASLAAMIRLMALAGSGVLLRHYRYGAWAVVFIVLILIPWMWRGVMLSGYLSYPSTLFSVDVIWKIPEPRAIEEARWVAGWARQPGKHPDEVLSNWHWFYPWLKTTLVNRWMTVVFPLLLFLCGGLFYIINRNRNANSTSKVLLFLLVPLISITFWFLTAPDVRFTGAIFWLLGAGAISISVYQINSQRYLNQVLFVASMAVTFVFGVNVGDFGLYVFPGPDRGFYGIRRVEVREFQTNSGLTLFVPNEGDQCWNAHLLCTPRSDPELRLIESGEISSGFTVESP